jgi:colicin import membrane protein
MSAQSARFEFAPPPTPGLVRAVGLAILAHGLLLAMLAAGVQWKHQAAPVTAEAELWSAIPQEAAPPLPLPEPEPVALPPESAPPIPVPVVAPEPDPSIAIAQEKERLEKEREKQQRLEKLAKDKKKQERLEEEKRLKEKQKKEKLQKDQEARDKALRDKAAADKAKQQDAKAAAADAKKLADLREQNLKRMAGLAAGAGGPNATGTAAQASGPSPGYYGRIAARIKANLVFADTVAGNPRVEVDIRLAPSGSILSVKIAQSSGSKAWDDAVVRAIEKTETLPADTDGRVPTTMQFAFRPKD